jgi:plasmid stabilization system protein ParE
MAKDTLPVISFSTRALANAETIKNYLLYKFTQREVNKFYELLGIFENIIVKFPQLYPKSSINSKVHRAVLSKQLSIFYITTKNKITVVAILDNRMSGAKWP